MKIPQDEGTLAYAGQTLKVGDRVTLSRYSDCEVGTVVKRTMTTALVRRHRIDLLNKPNSGESDALKVTPGGFFAHTEGQQRWEIDSESDTGSEKITFRAEAVRNGVRGLWKTSGSSNRESSGTVYLGWRPYRDFNF